MTKKPSSRQSLKYIISGSIIVVTVVVLIILATKTGSQYFLTVDELQKKGSTAIDQQVKVSGAVIGSSILYDPSSFVLKFQIANISGDLKEIESEGGLAAALHNAVLEASRARLQIIYDGIKPDLLKDEAQAILTGHLNADGTFTATEILLKCPTKYGEQLPSQVVK